jgi:hypothetical protein
MTNTCSIGEAAYSLHGAASACRMSGSVRPVEDPEALRWLAARTAEPEQGEVCGYDAGGWAAATWILNAMYEHPDRPAGVTYDDVEKAAPERRRRWRWIRRGFARVDVLETLGALTGVTLGRTGWPGAGWRRLLWSELGDRLGVDPMAPGAPGPRSFPYVSWPLSIEPPGEGSLDREQFERLVSLLAGRSSDGGRTRCVAFYGMLHSDDLTRRVVTSRLDDLVDLYDDEDVLGSPSNIWPEDRSWLVYTDWDLWGTKVSGDAALIADLEDDPALETAPILANR